MTPEAQQMIEHIVQLIRKPSIEHRREHPASVVWTH